MSTRKMLITKQYTEFNDILKENNFTDELTLFPDLNDIDVADLTYYLTLTFMGITKEEQFKSKVKELAEISEVILTEEKLDILSTLVYNFIIWLRTL